MSRLHYYYIALHYHSDVCYGQHNWQRQLEHGVLVERAEVGQREEADGGHQVDLETVGVSRTSNEGSPCL